MKGVMNEPVPFPVPAQKTLADRRALLAKLLDRAVRMEAVAREFCEAEQTESSYLA